MKRPDLSGSSSARRRYVGVAQQLLADIERGTFPVDETLPADRELAAQMGVSRATVREALLALEFIGVVEVRHGAGTYVRGAGALSVTRESSPLDAPPRELIESRQAIEPVVARRVAENISDDALVAVRRDLDEARDLVDEPEQLPRFIALGLRFHADLASGCGNRLLAAITAQLVDVEEHPVWTLLNQGAMSTAAARQRQVDEHAVVLDAILERRTADAENAMRSHLELLGTAILHPAMAASGSQSTAKREV